MPFKKYTKAQRLAYGRRMAKKRQRNTGRKTKPKKKSTKASRAVAMVSPLAEVKWQGNFLEAPNNILNAGGVNGDAMGIIAMGMGTDPIPNLLLQYPQRNFAKFEQGSGPNERVGRSLFIKQNVTNVRVEYLQHYYLETADRSKAFAPQYVRVMLVKGKQVQVQEPNNVTTNLFWNTERYNVGVNSANSAYKLQKYTINRSRWQVLADRKFVLGPSQLTSEADSASVDLFQTWNTTKYPSYKDMVLKIPVNKQVRYNDDSSGTPSNYDDGYHLIILNTPIGSAFDSGGTAPVMLRGLIGATISASTQALDL